MEDAFEFVIRIILNFITVIFKFLYALIQVIIFDIFVNLIKYTLRIIEGISFFLGCLLFLSIPNISEIKSAIRDDFFWGISEDGDVISPLLEGETENQDNIFNLKILGLGFLILSIVFGVVYF